VISHIENARRLYGPSAATMHSSLPDLGDSLNSACQALALNCTVDQVDQLTARLKAGGQILLHLRKALIAERG